MQHFLLGFQEGIPSSTRILQPSREDIQVSKHIISYTFSFYVSIFRLTSAWI
jgi:hypothetical protein